MPDSYNDKNMDFQWFHPCLFKNSRQSKDLILRSEKSFTSWRWGRVPSIASQELPEPALLLWELNRLEMRDDILYRKRQEGEEVQLQLVLPE